MMFLLDLIWLICKLIINLIKVTITFLIKLLVLILKTPILRFSAFIIILGLVFNIKFNLLATLFFIFLTHLCAINLDIYKKIHVNFSYFFDKSKNTSKIARSLKALKNNNIVLNNLHLENDNDSNCSIDDLVITDGGIFIIKTLNSSYDDFNGNSISKNISMNDDEIIDKELLYSLSEECELCNNILTEILSSDIPITNIIALPKDSSVIAQDSNLSTAVITAGELPFFINHNIDNRNKYSPTVIKYSLLENQVWIFDRIMSKTIKFISINKSILLFLASFIMLYFVYITFITFVFYKIIKI